MKGVVFCVCFSFFLFLGFSAATYPLGASIGAVASWHLSRPGAGAGRSLLWPDHPRRRQDAVSASGRSGSAREVEGRPLKESQVENAGWLLGNSGDVDIERVLNQY